MSYTKYPGEANNFEVYANGLKTKVEDTITGLHMARRTLVNNESKDLIVSKGTETIVNVIARIEKMKSAIKSDIKTVHSIANTLEQEELARRAAQARLKELEQEKQVNENA